VPCNVFCDVTFETAQTVPLLDLERADVLRCRAKPARHSMFCLSSGIRKCFVEIIIWLKVTFDVPLFTYRASKCYLKLVVTNLVL